MKLLVEDGVKKCYCAACEVFHDCTEHFVNSKNKHGYSTNCKSTTKNYYKEKKPSPDEYVRMGCDDILLKLGYDIHSNIPIYEQFLIKHDL
jgi:hypothetical protein